MHILILTNQSAKQIGTCMKIKFNLKVFYICISGIITQCNPSIILIISCLTFLADYCLDWVLLSDILKSWVHTLSAVFRLSSKTYVSKMKLTLIKTAKQLFQTQWQISATSVNEHAIAHYGSHTKTAHAVCFLRTSQVAQNGNW